MIETDNKCIDTVPVLCEPKDEAKCLECICYECPVITCEIRKKNWSEHCSKTGVCPMEVCASEECASEEKDEDEGNDKLVRIFTRKSKARY